MFRDEAPYIAEWILFHRLIGVERFWLFDHLSTDDWRSAIAPHASVVEVVPWPHPCEAGDARTRHRIQMDAIKAGLRSARGEVAWVAPIDVDEFLLPMRDRTVPECMHDRFSDAAAIYVNWRLFGTNHVTLRSDDLLLPQLTACSRASHPENSVGKSLVRPEKVDVDNAWSPHHFPLRHGHYVDGSDHTLVHDGHALEIPPKAATKYLRINHYNLRDESFYQSKRLAAAKRGHLDKGLERLLEHHGSFGAVQDKTILDFLREKHPAAYDKIWRSGKTP